MSTSRWHLSIKQAVLIATLMTLVSIDAVAAPPPPCGDPASLLPCPPELQIFGGEVNQGLRDYSLVAGKDTLVRVFVRVVPDILLTFPLRIDRAELDVKNTTDGSVSTVSAAPIHNPVTNTTQQFSENNNVNFYLNGSTLPAGDYQFTARLYNNSKTPIKEFDFGAAYPFGATADLRVLLAFGQNTYSLGKDADLSKDLLLGNYIRNQILPTVSRIYPIRRGIGTIDASADCSGDHTSGLRYFIYPDALNEFDPAIWEDALYRFNQMRLRPPLPPCDVADHVTMMFRSRFPCDTNGQCQNSDFFGGPEHGQGAYPGDWSWVSVSLNSKGTDGLGTMGLILSQELAHNYGLVDSLESNFDGCCHSRYHLLPDYSKPMPDQSAFNLLSRKSILPQFDSVMCCYDLGRLPEDETALLEAEDWNFLKQKLTISLPITIAPTAPVFYIVGTINSDDAVEILDSRLLAEGGLTDAPVASPYTMVFLNPNGRELASGRFGFTTSAVHPTDDEIPRIGKPFIVARPFPPGATEVQLRHNNNVIVRLRRSVDPPHVALLAPGKGAVFGPGNRAMLIQWEGRDPDGDPLTYTLSLSSDGGQTFRPIGSVFGPETTSYVWNTSFAPSSTKQGVIRVEASDGFNVAATSSESFTIALACDVNGDGSIDRNDIDAILRGRNTNAAPGDLRDADEDGEITVNDARICTSRCTKSKCAP